MLVFWSILIPIVFGVGMGYITSARETLKYGYRVTASLSTSIAVGAVSFILIALEEIAVVVGYKAYGFNIYESKGTMGLLIAQSVALVIFMFLYLCYIDEDEDEVVSATIVMFIIKIVLGLIICGCVRYSNVKAELAKMDYYEVGTETIYLEALNGNVTTEGEIHGGLFYISGHIGSTYEIYYATRKENGALEIDKIDYDKNVFDIFEDDVETPRIEVITHERKYYSPKEKELATNTYNSYVIYIPVGTYTGDYIGFN